MYHSLEFGVQHKERNTTNTLLIHKEAKKANISQALANLLAPAYHKLARAWEKYKSVHQLRNEFLCDQKGKAESEKIKFRNTTII